MTDPVHKDFTGSSYVESADYDADRQELTVTFVRNGDTALYAGVPPQVWTAFTGALSPGRFLREQISGRY